MPRSLPAADEVEGAIATRRRSQLELEHARAQHHDRVNDRIGHEATSARSGAELTCEAARDGLATTLDALDATDDALRDADGLVHEARQALLALGRSHAAAADAHTGLQDARERAEEAQIEVSSAGAKHGAAEAELDALRHSIGDEPGRLLEELRHIEATIKRLDNEEIPAAERTHEAAIGERASAKSAADAARETAAAAAHDANEASDRLRAITEMDGVLAAAVDDGTAIDADALLAAIPAGDEVSDSLVLSRFDAMEKSLPGGFDAALSEADGVKLVHVADDRGRRPLAAMTAKVAEEARAHASQAARTRARGPATLPAPRARRRASHPAGRRQRSGGWRQRRARADQHVARQRRAARLASARRRVRGGRDRDPARRRRPAQR